MTNHTTDSREKVRAKIIEAVPEIVEVKVGCILNLHAGESYGWMTIHQMTSVCKKHKKYREECGMEENGCSAEEAVFGTSGDDESWWMHTVKVGDIKPYQIVGRPITLADVLRAIGKTFGKYDNVQIYVNKEGAELICERGTYDGEGNDSSFVKVDLAADFDGQTDEVKEFIGKLLNV